MATFVDVYSSLNWANGLVLEHPKSLGEHTGWGLAGIGADFVGLLQPLAETGAKVFSNGRVAGAAATPIIQAGLLVMMGMSNTCGFGEPDKGGRFEQGANGFQYLAEALTSTVPPDTWEGESSDTYGTRNDEQLRRANRMAEVDRSVKEALEDEARQIDVTRKMLDRCQTVLGLAIPAAIALNAVPGWGQAASLAFQAAAVAGTVPPAEWRYLDLIDNSARNATVIRRAGAAYDQLAEDARA